ncbi:hypothetical protein KAT63_03820 [Candidatus Parcubacteria bacterium]|nr:hypothetical protein [Candidatus Parcubacteria bacterium]
MTQSLVMSLENSQCFCPYCDLEIVIDRHKFYTCPKCENKLEKILIERKTEKYFLLKFSSRQDVFCPNYRCGSKLETHKDGVMSEGIYYMCKKCKKKYKKTKHIDMSGKNDDYFKLTEV